MNEKQLGQALLKIDATVAAGGPNVQQLTWKILERDRRRVRWLGVLTTVFWMLTVTAVSVFSYYFFFAFRPRLQQLGLELSDPEMHKGGPRYEKWRDFYVSSLDIMDTASRIFVSGSIVFLFLAALT